ncbi:hypothetical protein [Neobacillus drentensis]|nr:hypothetical protein [Neobacillus drentensis]MDR7237110.1 hypothetical protein [Neobacillus drentensis]
MISKIIKLFKREIPEAPKIFIYEERTVHHEEEEYEPEDRHYFY